MPGAGCWVLALGTECLMLAAGSRVLGAGCWVLALGTECRMLAAGCGALVLGTGCWTLAAGCGALVLGTGCWVLAAAYGVLGVGAMARSRPLSQAWRMLSTVRVVKPAMCRLSPPMAPRTVTDTSAESEDRCSRASDTTMREGLSPK